MLSKALIVIARFKSAATPVRAITPIRTNADLDAVDPMLGWDSWAGGLPEVKGVSYEIEATTSNDPRLALPGPTIDITVPTAAVSTLIPQHMVAENAPAEFTPEPVEAPATPPASVK